VDQVERILGVAARLAASRRGRLAVVVKREGVPVVSDLWLECVERLRAAHAIDIEVLDIDNAVYQLIARAERFDVIVSSNMFGDVLADCGALLLGSRGLSYSGNFGEAGRAVYQTGHGAAYDIAGSGRANPAGQILSAAMMLEESFGWPEGARCVRESLAAVLARGIRTEDVAGSGHRVVGTREFGAAVCEAVRRTWR
jgi:3-isopropylmalate dehydrogenase